MKSLPEVGVFVVPTPPIRMQRFLFYSYVVTTLSFNLPKIVARTVGVVSFASFNCSLCIEHGLRDSLRKLVGRNSPAIAMPSFEMGVRGLRLRLGLLRSAGVAPHLLENWFEGKRLGAKTSVPKRFSNHPSVATYSEWAEREVDRLEGLG